MWSELAGGGGHTLVIGQFNKHVVRYVFPNLLSVNNKNEKAD